MMPTVPFEISYNGKSETIRFLSLYHPCPVRIENVQYDAVLSIGDAWAGNNLIVLVPINSSASGSSFLTQIAQYAVPVVAGASGIGEPVSVPTGAQWSLTQVISVGEGSKVSRPFFTWNSSLLKQKVLSDTPRLRRIGWASSRGPQYILMAEPISAAPGDLSTILQLPVTSPEAAIHPLGTITYKNAPPKDCKTCSANVSEVLNQFKMEERGTGSLSKETIGLIIMWVFAGIAMLWGLSVGLGWALDNVRGDMLRRWGDAIKNAIAKAMSKSKTLKVPALKSPLSSKPPAILPI